MATLDQFLEKALSEGQLVGDKADEATNKAFIDQIKKGGGLEGGPGQYDIFVKAKMTFKADSEEEAMVRASDALDMAQKKNRKLGLSYEIDGIDGPM